VRALLSIVYLAALGSVVGFVAYFYVLKHWEAGRVALLTLITPVSALWLGHFFASEPLGLQVWVGTALIMLGLVSHQWDVGMQSAVRMLLRPVAAGRDRPGGGD
jgi:drug/metabolite transporter (DMT)-like permease